ncbi:MAG: ComEC/Rec2 family competence protein [Tannerella sp.]|jgi:competence protein ComEC|nr:ComEC/Rec2 family competence protein [Tannerella sp.]
MDYGEGTVVNEMRKRPFVRPLIFWITGTVLQTCFPLQTVSLLLFAGVAVFVVVSFFVSGKSFSYRSRWVWGVLFACLLIFLSIQRMSLAERQAGRTTERSLLMEKAGEYQERMVNRLDSLHLSDEEKSVLATLTVNYRRNMPRSVSRQFSVTGLSHLLSVSGFHVGIISVFISMILSFMSERVVFFRYLRYLLTILIIWMFTYTTGLATAAVRAAVMISIYLAGRMLVRRPDKYNTLAGAAFCMLVYNPLYLFDIGFQLSYTAVFFILYLQPRLNRFAEVRNPLLASPWNTLTVTVSAQIGTVFLCFHYFGQSSLVFLFTNLFLSLLATILIPATLLWMTVPAWIPGTGILRWAIEAMTGSMMWVVERFSSIPGATVSIRFDFFTLVLSYLSLGLIMLYFRSRKFELLFAFLLTLFVILCWHLI